MKEKLLTTLECPYCDSTSLTAREITFFAADAFQAKIWCSSCSGMYTLALESTEEGTLEFTWFEVEQKLTPAQKRANTIARRKENQK
jgi:uncharacterized protein YbaR (Trm112 family)